VREKEREKMRACAITWNHRFKVYATTFVWKTISCDTTTEIFWKWLWVFLLHQRCSLGEMLPV